MPRPDEVRFCDPVHGEILVPREYCMHLIDTPIFQRLREIEQTAGIKVLNPGASHCRFSHSLGVWHLGQKAFAAFEKNARSHFVTESGAEDTIRPEDWKSYKKTFEIACLLHDCGHSPFSHLFEHHYDHELCDDLTPSDGKGRLNPLMVREATDLFTRERDKDLRATFEQEGELFAQDIQLRTDAKAHEKVGAILVLTHYSEDIMRLGANPILAARMILGYEYRQSSLGREKKLGNCLISLLNGPLDVDKLDYICRDTWASGMHNVSIDVDGLLFSLAYNIKAERLVYQKDALGIIADILEARIRFHQRVIASHKVVYHQELLKKAVDKLSGILYEKYKGEIQGETPCSECHQGPSVLVARASSPRVARASSPSPVVETGRNSPLGTSTAGEDARGTRGQDARATKTKRPCECEGYTTPRDFLSNYFSVDLLQNYPGQPKAKVRTLRGVGNAYLPTDGDLLSLLKRHGNDKDIPEMRQLFSRNHDMQALWSSVTEFAFLFKGMFKPSTKKGADAMAKTMLAIGREAQEVYEELFDPLGKGRGKYPEKIVALLVDYKSYDSQADTILIQMDEDEDDVRPYYTTSPKEENRPESCKNCKELKPEDWMKYHVYIPANAMWRKKEFIKKLYEKLDALHTKLQEQPEPRGSA